MFIVFFFFHVSGDTKCPGSFIKSGIFCYLVVGPGVYSQQVSSCSSIGGYLAKIGSSVENSAILDYVSGNPGVLKISFDKFIPVKV